MRLPRSMQDKPQHDRWIASYHSDTHLNSAANDGLFGLSVGPRLDPTDEFMRYKLVALDLSVEMDQINGTKPEQILTNWARHG